MEIKSQRESQQMLRLLMPLVNTLIIMFNIASFRGNSAGKLKAETATLRLSLPFTHASRLAAH